MQRSKQQALMFLLGAVLVGGVLGFSADRVFGGDKSKHWAGRNRMYDDLALSGAQRNALDSLLDERNCQVRAILRPVRPQLDSIRAAAHQHVLQILTPEQRDKLESRVQEMEKRREANSTKTTDRC